MSIPCDLAGVCGGCPWIGTPYGDQLDAKRERLRALWREVELAPEAIGEPRIETVGEAGLRDRVDLAFRRDATGTVLGLWDLDGSRLVDQPECPQRSPRLDPWVRAFREDLPPLERASVRLRVAPDGTRGLWLDLANADAKRLLDEGDWLRRQQERAIVEMGQRRKRIVLRDGVPKLQRQPELHPWLQTWLGAEEQPAPLYGPVGGFTQPGLEANRALVRLVRDAIDRTGAGRWLEAGCGPGNLTLPLARDAERVVAVDTDPLALKGLLRTRDELGLAEHVETRKASMESAAIRELLPGVEALLADPPRSGLRGLVDALAEVPPARRPRQLVYVSCFDRALARDAARLAELGYGLDAIAGLDQFPQSPHVEWVARFALDARS